jgi:hypothetical protein
MLEVANDLRWLGSGPRTGLHELILPSNEGPGWPGRLPARATRLLVTCDAGGQLLEEPRLEERPSLEPVALS